MKKTSFLFFFVALLSSAIFIVPTHTTHAATIGVPSNFLTLNTGLVGWWTFDGPNMTTNVKDSSGNSNSGYMSGFTSTSSAQVPGKAGQGLRFDGVDDAVNLGDVSGSHNVSQLTVSAWIKPGIADLSTTEIYVSKWRSTATSLTSWELLRTSAEVFQFGVNNQVPTLVTANSSVAYKDTKWHHVVGVYDGSYITTYVDGVPGTPVAQTGDVNNSTGYPVCLGTNNGASKICENTSAISKAIIDDVRIYSRALSAAEIQQLYNTTAGSKQSSSPQITNTNCTSGLSCGLVGYWTFDGKDMISNVKDVSGNGNNGYMSGFTSTSSAQVAGKAGQALRFDGVDDAVSMGDASTLEGMSAISVSAWVKPAVADIASNQDIVSKNQSGQSNGSWVLNRSSLEKYTFQVGTFQVGIGSSVNFGVSDNSYQDTKWHHLVGVYNGSTVQIYVDSVAADGTPGSLMTGNVADSTYYACIGRGSVGANCSGSNIFNGLLDDVRVYNRALSITEVQQLYNLGR